MREKMFVTSDAQNSEVFKMNFTAKVHYLRYIKLNAFAP